MKKIIYLRSEQNLYEKRAPICPKDVSLLINNGYSVYIEPSENRIFNINEYIDNGAIVTFDKWHHPFFNNALIIGLKDLHNLNELNNHQHIYFSHTYNGQEGMYNILYNFKNSHSTIYDLEFFTDKNNNRLVSFGRFAGISGCILGLNNIIYKNYHNKCITNINCINDISIEIENLTKYKHLFSNYKIVIIGFRGRCGNGVREILDNLKLDYDIVGKNEDIQLAKLLEYDIIFNCIHLSSQYNKIWFDKTTIFSNPLLIVDISCDYSKPNNPIAIYSKETTWENPVFTYNKFVDIIAINNLPSLIPRESSEMFSNNLTKLIIGKDTNYKDSWDKNEDIFQMVIARLSE